ncbi:MAG TPA: ATP-binding protein [Gemmatimonadaceae bacterium]|nr:ATP-binding protein [Gemmatimonadaceae bacterium]
MALLAASQWLHAPSVEYLIPLLVATVASIVTLPLVARGQRAWAIGSAVFLAVASLLAIPAQRQLWRIAHDWEGWRRDAAARGLAQLRSALDDELRDAARATRQALSAPTDRAAAFSSLAELTENHDDRGLALYRGDSAFAWAGGLRPGVDPTHTGTGVIATPFYLAVQVSAARGDARAAAVTLLDALPPADRVSSPLARRVAERAGLSGFEFDPPTDSGTGEVLHYASGGNPLFDVRAAPLIQGEVAQQVLESARARAGLAFALALVCFIIGVWRGTRSLAERAAALAVGLACTALVPLNQYSNLTRLFDPAVYFTAEGGPLTGNAGALAATSAIVLLGILTALRRRAVPASRWAAGVAVLLVAGLGPFLLRDLARGVTIPLRGVDSSLWLIWEIPLFLAAVSVLLVGTTAGSTLLGGARGVSPWTGPVLAAVAAVLAPVVWDAPGRWPWWYTFLWIGAIGVLALTRRSRLVILSASIVAALGATTLVWGRTSRGRVEAAERDVAGLAQPDSTAIELMRRFGSALTVEYAPNSREALLKRFVISDLASADNPVALLAWPTDSAPAAEFATAAIPIPIGPVAQLVARARQTGAIIIDAVPTPTALETVMAVPAASGGVTAVVLAPKSRLFAPDPFARLIGLEGGAQAEPPYTVRLREPGAEMLGPAVSWRREGSELHGDRAVRTGAGIVYAHVEVELRSLSALVERGALIVLLDLAIVGLLWLGGVVADGGAGRWFRARRRRWARSYRARLSLALFAFFVIPAAAFAVSSYEQLANDATQSRALLVLETLRAVEDTSGTPAALAAAADRADAPLFLYRGGMLLQASDPLYAEIAPTGRYLTPATEIALAVRDEETDTRVERIDHASTLFGYRTIAMPPGEPPVVIGTPAHADELALGRRRRDLGILVLFATVVGALAALWLSGVAARQLARPIGTLRGAALAIAGGELAPPLEAEPTAEFQPVFAAFRRMTADLNASRSALEEAQRRTTAVLRNVASGVIAVDPDGRVSLANPRAETLLGASLGTGTALDQAAPREIADVVARFLASRGDEERFELALEQQQLRGTLTRLSRGGAVITLDDVTELARAQRVLAWGEMARQVAHEIKNPLTPIRLGVQHLKRARADARVDFDRVLDQNVSQILAEIDRLDEIARAFSRYGAAPNERPRAERVDAAAVVREVVSLERMGQQHDVEWREAGTDVPVFALARADELKEVLLNVLENARHAGARTVTVALDVAPDDAEHPVRLSVRDDGHGIAPDVLPRIFEPHFSTRTSGSGLGLAISRQLVESWGGEIGVESSGAGTRVEMRLRAR